MGQRKIIVGTRGSDLALVQADATEAALRKHFPELEITRKIIKTTGDRRTDVALSEVAKSEGTMDKGVFTKELELALAAGEIDLAVHSMKDVPTVIDSEFSIVGTLARAGVRDVIITKSAGGLAALPLGSRVGTSSVRRAKQLQWLRPDLQLLDLRGNVPTRVKKLADADDYDAIMLAEAGLDRLGFLGEQTTDLYYDLLAEDYFFPAAGQGAIGFEIRTGDEFIEEKINAISDPETFLRVQSEREFLRLLDGGCHTPVGVYSSLKAGVLSMSSRVFPEAGGTPLSSDFKGDSSDWKSIANELFLRLK